MWKEHPQRLLTRGRRYQALRLTALPTPWWRAGFVLVVTALSLVFRTAQVPGAAPEPVPGGALYIVKAQGHPSDTCPLKHTDVEASIQGFFSRVKVRQTFHNPLDTKIEAVYVFPLPQEAAVDHLVMTVGDRRIVGQIKPRHEARAIYEAARAAGHVASLLDQERPNIFTQSVANVEPGAQVVIEITYVETLRYEDGQFEFVFPMVVGPRYMPSTPTGKRGPGWASDTTRVPDASRISPPVALPGTRAGHDISLTVHIDAGTELFDIASTLHDVHIARSGAGRATVTLARQTELPNKDFILRYRTATDAIGDALLLHQDARGTFFSLILQPPQRLKAAQAVPKEMIFVIDRSGSMSGFPIDKARDTMRLAIAHMNPHDTFNLLSFAGGTGRCFPQPVPNTAQNRATALRYLADLYGSGGTEMMPAIMEALGGAHDPQRLRVVAFMTDGYIGNDYAIIDAVRQHAGTSRVFAFGIGNAVNRFLLDGMAHGGRGAVEYVTLQRQADTAITRFHQRIHAPVLTDISLDWGTLPVSDVYPRRVPDLFSSQPLVLHGRLTHLADGTLTVRGRTSTGELVRQVHIGAAAAATMHDTLPALWARAAIADVMRQDYGAFQSGNAPEKHRQTITALGVEFHLVTPFTSFVAVEEMTVTVGGKPMTIAVPVELPDGVRYEGIFGARRMAESRGAQPAAPFQSRMSGLVLRDRPAPASLQRREVAKSTAPAALDEPSWQAKLAPSLVALEERVRKDGIQGTLTIDNLRVEGYMVDVMLYLRDTAPETRAALKQLGFEVTGESKAVRLLIGRLDVRQLQAVAQLEAVLRITPVVG
jgi:Ca-activated chloride channel family protein